MACTRERILRAALRLFAADGYAAVSVSQIAGALGMTKGALYKHFKNKQDIFDQIFAYVCALDAARARQTGVPEQEFSEGAETCVSADSLKAYMALQFRYWSEDEIACDFRRMVTLEQYRSAEMGAFYQKVLAGGPLAYIEGVLRGMTRHTTGLNCRQIALEVYAPFYLLLSLADAAPDRQAKRALAARYCAHLDALFYRYGLCQTKTRKEQPYHE